MDSKKISQFVFHAISMGHNPNEILQYLSSKLPKQSSNSEMTSDQPVSSAMSLIQKYFPADQVQNALKVMQGESGGRANAIGDNYPIDTGNGPETIPSYGLFQIRGLPGRPAPQQLLDPEQNVKYAADLFKRSGWGPWTAAQKLGLVNKG